jgi:hypothetical protein
MYIHASSGIRIDDLNVRAAETVQNYMHIGLLNTGFELMFVEDDSNRFADAMF